MLDHFTDEELALKAQAGDSSAEAVLASRYTAVTHALARDFRIRGIEIEDAQCELMLTFVAKAIRLYQPDRGAKFGTYARRVMGSRLIDMYRERHQKSVVPPDVQANLDDLVSYDGEQLSLADVIGSGDDLAGRVAGQISDGDRVEAVLSRTWPPFRDLLRGIQVRDIASTHSLSIVAVKEIIGAIAAIGAHRLSPDLYSDLLALLSASDSQPALIDVAPMRGSKDADVIAFEVFRVFRETKMDVIQDLVDGYSYAEIASRRNLSEESVSALLAAIRSIASAMMEAA